MERLRMAVIGVGHLGKEHARILSSLADVELVGVADVNEAQARTVAAPLNTRASSDHRTLLDDVDAACIVVPTPLHERVAADFLVRGIPLLVEKPLASSQAAANRLVALAREGGVLLQVGHIERFNPAFEQACQRRLAPWLIRAERLGPFSGRSADTGVVMDLMIHDLDLILALVGRPVESVAATGISVFGAREDIVNARIQFAGGCVAEVTASRAHPTPSRQMHVWGPCGYAHLDLGNRRATFTEPSPWLRAQGLDPARLGAEERANLRQDLFTRYLPTSAFDGQGHDQLSAELKHFVQCVRTGMTPRVTGEQALDAISLAERVLGQMQSHSWTQAGGSMARAA